MRTDSIQTTPCWKDIDSWTAKTLLLQVKAPNTSADVCAVTEFFMNCSTAEPRICIARCIARSSRIVLVDEATSCVDGQTDALIQEARTVFWCFFKYKILYIDMFLQGWCLPMFPPTAARLIDLTKVLSWMQRWPLHLRAHWQATFKHPFGRFRLPSLSLSLSHCSNRHFRKTSRTAPC